MEKKMWVKPEVSVVEFAANEYMSSCVETYNHFNMTGKELFFENSNSVGDTLNYYEGTQNSSWSDGSLAAGQYWATTHNGGLGYGDNKYDTQTYFNYMVSNRNNANGYDQQIYFNSARKNSEFTPCGLDGVVDLSEETIYDGWWSEEDERGKTAWGKLKIWWNDRWHAATISANKS